jgi:hypothetical protein
MHKLSAKLKQRIIIAVTSEKYGNELIDAIEAETSGSVFAGVAAMADGINTFTVNLPITLSDNSYALTISISNTVDVTVRHLDPTITAKTTTSFSFHTDQTTDHPNYKVNYIIAY